jgi:hypothetical protein
MSMFLAIGHTLRAQTTDVRNVVQPALFPALDVFQFDLVVKRLSDRWQYWANSTMRLQSVDLEPTGGFNPAVHQFTFIPDSSDLNLVPYNAGSMNGYFVDYAIVDGDLVVNVIGPDSVGDAHALNPPDSLRIGRFQVRSTDNSIVPEELVFAMPYDYYQANAFKLDHDSVTGVGSGRNVWFNKHDNPPMVAEYEELPPPPDICDATFNFYGQYVGDLNVMLGFTVDDEHCYEGYIIERALVSRAQPDLMDFQGRAQLTYLNEPRLVACFCLDPQVRDSLFDQVDFRRETYAYRLIGKRLPFYGDTLEIIDTIFIRIPNAIISNARILDNPFSSETSIRFNVDDRLRLTARCYDLGGRLIASLEDEDGRVIEDVEYPIGTDYRVKFKAPDVASQGLLNMILVGVPVDDLTFASESRVIIKAQLLR